MTANGRNPPSPPVLVGETSVVIHVLHFADGTASSELHVTYGGNGHLEHRPKMLARIVKEQAEAIAGGGLYVPRGGAGGG